MKKALEKTVAFATMESIDNRQFNSVGSSRIRARWLLPYWEEAEEYRIGKKYEVLIYQKAYWEAMMKEFVGIQILDVCDPDFLEGRDVFRYVDMVDAFVTSTEALAEYARKIRPKALIKCIPDRVYLPEHRDRKVAHTGRAKTAVWFGYWHNAHYLQKTFDDLIKNNIALVVISDQAYTPPYAYSALKVINIPYKYPKVHEELIKYDMALLPPSTDDLRGKFKSNNKVLTAKALGMPVVQMPNDLQRFLDPEERKRASLEGIKEVEEKWDVQISVREYKQLIEEIKERKNIL